MSEASLANLRPFKKGEERARVMGARGGRATKKAKVTEILREQVEARAEEILRPYFEALPTQVREEWSPATKLEFFLNQTQVAEKMLNRVEGTPVTRTKLQQHDEVEDPVEIEDLSPAVLVQLVAAIITTGGIED